MEERSPDRPKDVSSANPPVVRPVREILGENTIPLRVIEPPKPAARSADGSAHTQVGFLMKSVHHVFIVVVVAQS